MDYDEMVKKILEIFPNAEIGEDDEGQMIVYTDLKIKENDGGRYLGPMGLEEGE